MKVVVFNLGCKVNQYDSDVIIQKLIDCGYEVSEQFEPADIYILNTCAVTSEAERKSRQAVSRALKQNPKAEVFVCGCASERNPESFNKDGVKYVSGVAKKTLIADLTLRGTNVADIPLEYEECGFAHSMRTRDYLKVQEGCNNFCSYCIVPYLRGRSRSRRIEAVVEEAKKQAETSKELVVTGINLSAYGLDIGLTLTDLIKALTELDVRVRLGSLEVNVISDEFLQATKGLKKFCPQFHLSLQSGDDDVLKKMNRHYTTAEYFEKVKLIRYYYPEAAITTDIIAGFPEESEKSHKSTLEFAKIVAFSDIHAFAYSKRDGTPAAKMKQLADDVKSKRSHELSELKTVLKREYEAKFIGRPLNVLFEENSVDKNGYSSGYSENYIKIYTKCNVSNQIKTITPTGFYADGLLG